MHRLAKLAAMMASMVCFGACAMADGQSERIFHTSEANQAAGFPFSDAVEVDGWIYLSGTLGIDPATGRLATGGIEAEARQTMDNIQANLERLGSSMDDIIKCTVMIDDMADWPAFNTVYRTYFDDGFPARSAFGADGLALGAVVEVECIAKR